jgi:hypothetical protein
MNVASTPPVEAPDLHNKDRLRGLPLLFWTLTIAIAAGWVLALFSPVYKPERLHVQDMYVDQLGYITTARWLHDKGELRNGVLVPSQIANPDFRPYMPGHFYALAASYSLFGYSTFSTLLPSLASFVLIAVLLFLIGNRLYGRWSGTLAAFAFVVYPAEITYAFTAMAELTFTLAGLTALFLFLTLPRRLWPFAPALLLVLPFLFRESGAFLIVPLALLVYKARGLLWALVATGSSVVSLKLINAWQIADGKLAASLAWVTSKGFNYTDAFPPPVPELSTRELLSAIGDNTVRNLGLLQKLLSDWPGELMPTGLVVILLLVPVLLIGGFLRWGKDPIPLGAGLLLLLVLVLALTLYDVQAHKMMRTAMFVVPIAAIGLAGIVRPEDLIAKLRSMDPKASRIGLLASAALLLITFYGSYRVCERAGARMTKRDDAIQNRTDVLAQVHNPETVIVGPLGFGPMYAVEHYPVRWSFPPANLETYREIAKRYRVGTILSGSPYTPEIQRVMGIRLTHTLAKAQSVFYVYKTIE